MSLRSAIPLRGGLPTYSPRPTSRPQLLAPVMTARLTSLRHLRVTDAAEVRPDQRDREGSWQLALGFHATSASAISRPNPLELPVMSQDFCMSIAPFEPSGIPVQVYRDRVPNRIAVDFVGHSQTSLPFSSRSAAMVS